MRILVLHGYGQTSEIMRRNGNLSRAFKGHELVYLDAPHAVVNQNGNPGRSWWTYADAPLLDCTVYTGIEESIELIRQQLPCDGIIGFSQGGTFASILCYLIPAKFCILIGAYMALDPEYKKLYGQDQLSAIYHIVGEKDVIVAPSLSGELHRVMGGKLILHPGGHIIPKLRHVRDEVDLL